MLTEIEKLFYILRKAGVPESELPKEPITANYDSNLVSTDENNKITKITLYNISLNGTISPIIGDLNKLKLLELYNGNGLSGLIPVEIGKLNNLTRLNFAGNKLTGEIPSIITNLTNLTSLDLSSNQLTGTIPSDISNLNNLTSLQLGSNQLTGEIPSKINSLNNLTFLELSNNQLIGEIPTISNLSKIQYLYLQNNCLELEKDSYTEEYLLVLKNKIGDEGVVDINYNNFHNKILNPDGPNSVCKKQTQKPRMCYNSKTSCFKIVY